MANASPDERARVLLREATDRYQLLVELMPDGIVVHRNGRLLYANSAAARFVKAASPEALLGRAITEFVHSDDLGALLQRIRALTPENPISEVTECLLACDDGTTHPIESTSVLTQWEGQPAFQVIMRDLTEARRAEAALRYQASLVASVSDAIIGIDENEAIQSWNAAAERIYGWSAAEVTGRRFGDVVQPRLVEFACHSVLRHHRSDGTELVVRSSVSALPATYGQPAGAVIICADITQQYEAQHELALALEVAQQASSAKSEFLSHMTHELRTPLNAIVGFSELLALDFEGTPEGETTEHILKAGRHLLGLIDDVLDIGRMDNDHLPLTLGPQILDDVVDECLSLVAHLARERSVTVRVVDDRPTLAVALGDRRRLRQVLVNLVSNAIKYNRPDGVVTLRWERRESIWRLFVDDTGLGIRPELMPRLFKPFDRLDADTTDVEGTGVGLALSKQLVELMGGSIDARSTPGTGTSFWIDLPADPSPNSPNSH